MFRSKGQGEAAHLGDRRQGHSSSQGRGEVRTIESPGLLRGVGRAMALLLLWAVLYQIVATVARPLQGLPAYGSAPWRLVAEVLPLVAVLLATTAMNHLKTSQWPCWPHQSARDLVVRSAAGVAMGLVLFVLSFGALAVLGIARVDGVHGVSELPLWLLACALNATFQELLIHGVGFRDLSQTRGGVAGAVVALAFTTVVFTLLHPGAFEDGPVAVANIALFGLLLGIVVLRERGIVTASLLHAVWNCVGGIGLGVVSLADDYPCVADGSLVGPRLLAGGSMGLEGSFVTTVVLLVALILASRVLIRRFRFAHRG